MMLLQRLVIGIINFLEHNVRSSSEKAVLEQLKAVPLGNENFVSKKKNSKGKSS